MKKSDFKVLHSPERRSRRPDKYTYGRALERFMEKHQEELSYPSIEEWHEKNPDSFHQLLHLCVIQFRLTGLDERKQCIKQYIKRGIKQIIPAEDVKKRLDIMVWLIDAISVLTPRELTQIFPITKRYDGARWQEKDYFYTMDKLSRLNMDRPIREQVEVFDLLLDYINRDIELFMIEVICAMNNKRQIDGRPGFTVSKTSENDGRAIQQKTCSWG